MALADQLKTRMRIFAVLQALGFFSWQAGEGFARSHQTPESLIGPAFIVSGVGVGVWLVSLIIFLSQAWHAKKAVGYDVINDEWARHVRKRAAETAFWLLTVAVVVSTTLANFGVDAQLLLQINTGLAVAGFLLANVYWDSRHEDRI